MPIKKLGYLVFVLASAGLGLFAGPAAGPARAADLYLSGGGGGGGGGGASIGNGGGWGGAGAQGHVGSTAPLPTQGNSGGGGASGGSGGSGGGGGGTGGSAGLAGGSNSGEYGGQGGAGGDALKTLSGNAAYGVISIRGGNGGDGGYGFFGNLGGAGGAGGRAGLDAGGYDLTISETLILSSGQIADKKSDGAPGPGGAASLQARSLVLIRNDGSPVNVNLTRHNGELLLNVGSLDASQADVNLTLNGTLAYDSKMGTGVGFGDLVLGGGHTFKVTQNFGDYAFDSLTVKGQAVFDGDLDAAGKNLDFQPQADTGPGSTLLKVTGSADLSDATLSLSGAGGLGAGDSARVLDVQGVFTSTGLVLDYDASVYDLALQEDGIYATLKAMPAGYEVYGQAMLARLVMLNLGSDLLLYGGMDSAVTAGQGDGPAAFGLVGGGHVRQKTGSHIDVDGVNLLSGLARGWEAGAGRLTLGAAFEAGFGSYDAKNSFNRFQGGNGDGDVNYYGLALLGHWQLENGLYLEASGRAGRVKGEFSSDNVAGQSASFDSTSWYYGAHAGLGWKIDLSSRTNLDLYLQGIWTGVESDSFNLNNDDIHLDGVDSLRSRLGARAGYALTDNIRPYLGAAWDFEHDGKARSSANGDRLRSSETRGGSALFEGGLSFSGQDIPLTLDLGLQGYTGRREGLTGTLQLKWTF